MEYDFDVYRLDNEGILINRIAAKLNSLTRFLDVISVSSPDGKVIGTEISSKTITDIKKYTKIRVTLWDAYTDCRNAATKRDSLFSVFYKMYRDRIQKLKLDTDMAFVWLYQKIKPRETDEFLEFFLDNVTADMESVIPNLSVLVADRPLFNELTYKVAKGYVENTEREIFRNRDSSLRLENTETLQKDIVSVYTTPFEDERIRIVFQTDIKTHTLFEIFNAISLSQNFPFAIMNTFYKILKNVSIKSAWIDQISQDKIKIKYTAPDIEEDIDVEMEIRDDALFIITEIEPRGRILIGYMSGMIKKLLPSINFSIVKQTFEDITGVFYVPSQRLDLFVFEHLVINNSAFSNFYVDESEKAARVKSSVYVYFDSGSELISFILTAKRMDKYDPTMRDKDKTTFPELSPYLRVRIVKAKTQESINTLVSIFSKIITVYNSEYTNVVDFYRMYIPDFAQTGRDKGDEKGEKALKEKFLKIDPELFSGLYTRKCRHQPEILPESEIDSVKKDEVMIYPKTPQEGTQRYYTCQRRKDAHKFVGLRLADEITTKYNYVPCCFKTDQHTGNTPYNRYFENIPAISQEKVAQQRLVTGTKFLEYNKYGKLDEFGQIKNILTDPNEDFVYYRWGVDRSKRSFLQCIVEAITSLDARRYDEYGYDKASEASRLRSLDGILYKMTMDIPLLNTARQSLFDKTIADISDMILDRDTYLNPLLLTQLFEAKFNCKIFAFSQSGLMLPRSAKSILVNGEENDSRPVIIILEHTGSSTDLEKSYPRCEVIVRANRTKSSQVSFAMNQMNPVVQYIGDIYLKMIKSGIGSKLITPLNLPQDIINEAKGQIINAYGKTGAIITKDNFILYLAIPICPLALPEMNNYEILDEQATTNYLQKFNINYIHKSDTAITVRINTFEFSIPILYAKALVTCADRIVVPNFSTESVLARINDFKKIAKYLSEFIIYVFSQYLAEKKITTITDTIIENFVKERIVIDKTVKYRIRSRFFETTKSTFMQGSKLVVKSEELLKRLVFTLRLYITQHFQDVFEYYKRKSIEGYIINLTDFEEMPQQIILEGRNSVIHYMHSRTARYTLTDKIVIPSSEPYFFKNIMVGPSVYLAVNVEDFEDAQSIVNNWLKKQLVSVFPTDTSDVNWDVYAYNSETAITPIEFNNRPVKLLSYKYEDEQRFTVMLNVF